MVPRNTNCLYLHPGQVRVWHIKAATSSKPEGVTGWVCFVSVGAVTLNKGALTEVRDAHQPSLEITCPTKLPLIQHQRSLSHSKCKAWVAVTCRLHCTSPWARAQSLAACRAIIVLPRVLPQSWALTSSTSFSPWLPGWLCCAQQWGQEQRRREQEQRRRTWTDLLFYLHFILHWRLHIATCLSWLQLK